MKTLVMLVLLAPLYAIGQDQLAQPVKPQTTDEKAAELVKPLREAYDKDVKAAQEKYKKVLDVELEKATKAGSLDDVKAIKKEMEDFEADETKWKSAVHKAAIKRYAGEKEAAQKKWDLGIANIVRGLVQKKELETAEKVKGKDAVVVAKSVSELILGKWSYDGGIAEFKNSGTASLDYGGRKKDGKWYLRGNSIVIEWGGSLGSYVHEIEDISPGSAQVKVTKDPRGRTGGFAISRLP